MDLDLIKSKLGALQPEKKEKYEKVDYTTLYWKPREEGKFVIRFVPSKFNAQYPFQEVFLHYGFTKRKKKEFAFMSLVNNNINNY